MATTKCRQGIRIRRTEAALTPEQDRAACAGHLGHVFEDGPRPTGLGDGINGTALTVRALIDEAAE